MRLVFSPVARVTIESSGESAVRVRADDCSVRNISFRRRDSSRGAGISVAPNTTFTVLECKIGGFGTGVECGVGSTVSLGDCVIERCTDALSIDRECQIRVTNCQLIHSDNGAVIREELSADSVCILYIYIGLLNLEAHIWAAECAGL